jgi:hypothetical protein
MIFAYLDEFGHVGPFFGRHHPTHNTSPIFGLAGILLPEAAVRPFATFFLQHKRHLLAADIDKSGKQGYEWEKKGTNLFTAKSLERYPAIRQSMFSLINRIKKDNGRIFYSGRQKIYDREDLNANGLYATVFAHAIRQIDSYCRSIDENYILIVDENSARKELLETAAKTMFGKDPTRKLLSPPFEVESYLNQNIQAADWISSIVGRMWNSKIDPDGFGNYVQYQKYFWDRLHSAATHSSVMTRAKQHTPPARKRETVVMGGLGRVILEAQEAKLYMKTTTTIIETTETISPIDNDG